MIGGMARGDGRLARRGGPRSDAGIRMADTVLPVGWVYGKWVERLPELGEAAIRRKYSGFSAMRPAGYVARVFHRMPWKRGIGKLAAYLYPGLDATNV